jgi:hypothetical protein
MVAGVPIFDFPVLSDDPHPAGKGLDVASPGDVIVYEEGVWELVGERQRGGHLGSVIIQETVTLTSSRRPFVASFDLDGYGPIVVNGFVPGDGSWKGVGRGEAHGAGRTGSVRIEGWNPKGWG